MTFYVFKSHVYLQNLRYEDEDIQLWIKENNVKCQYNYSLNVLNFINENDAITFKLMFKL